MNILYGLLLQLRGVLSSLGTVEFREAKRTLCFILFISLQGPLWQPLDCFCHGQHPQKSLRTEKLRGHGA